jgi:hypothetical protein
MMGGEFAEQETRRLDSEYAFTKSMPEDTKDAIKTKRESFGKIASNGHCGRSLAQGCRIEDERLEKLALKR